MLVSEIVEKLKKCPQNVPVKLYDNHENNYYEITEVTKITEDYGETTSYVSLEVWEE